jgi:hypothetical protein
MSAISNVKTTMTTTTEQQDHYGELQTPVSHSYPKFKDSDAACALSAWDFETLPRMPSSDQGRPRLFKLGRSGFCRGS